MDKLTSDSLLNDVALVLNRYSAENASNTPDFILAEYLRACLMAYDAAVQSRATWYGRMDIPGQGSVPLKDMVHVTEVQIRGAEPYANVGDDTANGSWSNMDPS